jgi:hypothetical protein
MDDVARTGPVPGSGRIPLALGLALIAVMWPLNWALEGDRTHVLFFPLWLGYVLAVDGLVQLRTGTSILRRSPRIFLALFPLSVPTWWLFEAFNERLGNWEYLGDEAFSDLEYFLYCSLSFSTVVPAVFESAELARSFRFVERFRRGPVFPRGGDTLRYRWTLALIGAAMLVATLAWPRWCYPFVWTSIVFLLEPLCLALGRRSFTADLLRGDWRDWMALWIGGLLCGFFWEMWNLHSYPKWIYHVPGVGFGKVFEMPILGYLGYLPFAMELFLAAQLALPRRADVPFGGASR